MGKIYNDLMEIANTNKGAYCELAKYLLELETIKNLTISDITEACYVSSPTPVRLSKKLGFSGFSEFKINYEMELKESKNFNQEKLYKDIVLTDFVDNIYASLETTLSHMNEEVIKEIIDLMYIKKKILCCASGGTNVIAADFVYKLRRVGYNSFIHSDYHIQYVEAKNSDSETLIFAISYSGTTKDILKLIDIGLENDATIILVTGNKKIYNENPKVKKLLIETPELANRNYSILSRTVIISVLDFIYLKYIYQNHLENNKKLQKTTLM